jgi:hypothetical protein
VVGESEKDLMRRTSIVFLLAAVALGHMAGRSDGQVVDLSLNVFPTSLANPSGGGTWNIVAKTSGNPPGQTNFGIAAISAYLRDVNVAGLMVEADLNSIVNGGMPFSGVFAGNVNIVYGQDITMAPIIAGVGLPAFSDGPDPLGSAFWNGATKIFKGTYSGTVPSWSSAPGFPTGANVLVSTSPGTAAAAASVNTVARVQVPEPGAIAMIVSALGFVALRGRRRVG